MFPLTSVTVKVTVFAPTSEQSKLLISILVDCIPQASNDPPSI